MNYRRSLLRESEEMPSEASSHPLRQTTKTYIRRFSLFGDKIDRLLFWTILRK